MKLGNLILGLTLCTVVGSCNFSDEPEAIPLHHNLGTLYLNLPSELDTFKTSIHISDYKAGDRIRTVFVKKDFQKFVKDSTGWVDQLYGDTIPNSVLILEQELYSYKHRDPQFTEEDLWQYQNLFKSEHPEIEIIETRLTKSRMELLINGLRGGKCVKEIHLHSFVNGEFINLSFFDFKNRSDSLSQQMWANFANLRIEPNSQN